MEEVEVRWRRRVKLSKKIIGEVSTILNHMDGSCFSSFQEVEIRFSSR